MKTYTGSFDTSEFGLAWLVEQERQEEVALPSDWTAYFARRLGALNARQVEREPDFQETASARHSKTAAKLH